MNRALAETYERVSGSQLEGGTRLAERLGVKRGTRVLDVGCGPGRLARWLTEHTGPEGLVVGLDPSAEHVALARARVPTARFEVGRAEDLSAFSDGSFDVVCMSSVLHWVEDQPRALAEARRVLRPGGLLGVTTSPAEMAGASTLGRVFAALLARAPYAGHVDPSRLTAVKQRRTTTELIGLVLSSGLALLELELAAHTRTHDSGEAVVEFIEASAFGTFLQPVPAELRARLRADLVSAFDASRSAEGVLTRGWALRFIAARA